MLNRVKLFLGIEVSDNNQDELIAEIITVTEGQLKMLLDAETLPNEVTFIIHELVIQRYNRLGSEGMESENIEGYSVKYSGKDFKPYEDFLSKFMPRGAIEQGGVSFY